MRGGVAEPVSRAHAAMLAFHQVAMEQLYGLPRLGGRRPSATVLAELIDIDRSHYSHCLSGTRGTFDTLVEWLDAWNLAGLPKLEMLVEGAGPIRFRRVRK